MIAFFVVAGAGLLMLGVERWRPSRRWPFVRGWVGRALLLNAVQVGIVVAAGSLWDDWMHAHRLWSAESLGPVLGVACGYLAITFVYYWWHRARHDVDLLWRVFHQVHHSPQRLELITSFYKHPIEILANGLLSSAILFLGVGLSPTVAGFVVMLTGLAELFYHWNVATPYWLGFLFQRPESHCVHHEQGRHDRNYSDLPLWDMVFGTFHNPRQSTFRCGFGGDAERRLGRLLLGQEVSS